MSSFPEYHSFKKTLRKSKPGQQIIYYVGSQAYPLGSLRWQDRELNRITKLAWNLSELGYAHLFQRREENFVQYLIVPVRRLMKGGMAEECPITEAERLPYELENFVAENIPMAWRAT